MAAYVFATIPTNYNDGVIGADYSDMTQPEIDLNYEVFDIIISALLPDWLSWCGDELLAETGDDRVDTDFDINSVLARAYEILISDEIGNFIAEKAAEGITEIYDNSDIREIIARLNRENHNV